MNLCCTYKFNDCTFTDTMINPSIFVEQENGSYFLEVNICCTRKRFIFSEVDFCCTRKWVIFFGGRYLLYKKTGHIFWRSMFVVKTGHIFLEVNIISILYIYLQKLCTSNIICDACKIIKGKKMLVLLTFPTALIS